MTNKTTITREALERYYNKKTGFPKFAEIASVEWETILAALKTQEKLENGYVLVPVEPTGDILKAMCDCEDDAPWAGLYKAMITQAKKDEGE